MGLLLKVIGNLLTMDMRKAESLLIRTVSSLPASLSLCQEVEDRNQFINGDVGQDGLRLMVLRRSDNIIAMAYLTIVLVIKVVS